MSEQQMHPTWPCSTMTWNLTSPLFLACPVQTYVILVLWLPEILASLITEGLLCQNLETTRVKIQV